MSQVLRYRADIDGLRAFAVLPVVLYHAGILGFSGGYVGVDVFFVISGYLITAMIWSEVQAGAFSLVKFYERRARRILPALFAVIVASIVMGGLYLMPSEFQDLSKSALATTFFVSNIHFRHTLNYFTTAAEFRPLLHTWSLAVEEQFYIIFPLLLLLAARLSRRPMLVAMAALFLISLVASIYATHRTPASAFFLLPTRAWELLLGSFLALGFGPRLQTRRSWEVAAAGGILLILVPVFAYTEQTSFPGLAAIPICAGTAILLQAGMEGQTVVGRVLSVRPVVFVGLISYSLYLWHWPILVCLRYYFFLGHLDIAVAIVGIFLSLIVAVISWHFIEGPFRKPGRFSRRQVFSFVGSSTVAICLVCIVIWTSGGLPARLAAPTIAMARGATDIDSRHEKCHGRRPADGLCEFGAAGDHPPTFLLWGDSHAGALLPAVEVAAVKVGRKGLIATKGACPPLIGVRRIKSAGLETESCRDFNDSVLEMLTIEKRKIDTVILSARWALSATGQRVSGEVGRPVVIFDNASITPRFSDNINVFRRGLTRTVETLNRLGLSVVILGDVPEIGWHVPRSLATAAQYGVPSPQAPTLSTVLQRTAAADAIIRNLTSRLSVSFVPLANILCEPKCLVVWSGRPVYSDDDHLSFHGAKNVVGPALVNRLWQSNVRSN